MVDGDNSHFLLSVLFLYITFGTYSCTFLKIFIVFYGFGHLFSKSSLLWIFAKQTVAIRWLPVLTEAFHVIYMRGAQVTDARLLGRRSFIRWRLILVYPL